MKRKHEIEIRNMEVRYRSTIQSLEIKLREHEQCGDLRAEIDRLKKLI
jgi:hypothetical protein